MVKYQQINLLVIVVIYFSIFAIPNLSWAMEMWSEKCLSFEGSKQNGLKNGYGRCIWSDGSYYEGNYRHDKMNGKGAYYDAMTGTKVIGDFVNDIINGNCNFLYANGDRFEGQCKNNRLYTGKYFLYNGGIRYYSKGVPLRR